MAGAVIAAEHHYFVALDQKAPPELVRDVMGAPAGNRRIFLEVMDEKTMKWRPVSEIRPGEHYRVHFWETSEFERKVLERESRP